MDKDDANRRIKEEDDYVRCPKFNNSLSKFLSKNTKEVEDKVIAKLLMITEEKVRTLYKEAIEILKREMKDK